MTEPTFHAGSKLAWIEQIAIDRESTDFEVRVALAISRRIRGSGEAHIPQETIANTIGASVRGVRRAIVALQKHGHLDVDAVGLGRGKATQYRPIVKKRNPESAFPGDAMTKKRTESTRNSEAQKADSGDMKSGLGSPPKIPYKSPFKNPGARARPGDPPPDFVSLQLTWQAIKDRLVNELGADIVREWFGNVEVQELRSGGSVVLSAPTKFTAKWVLDHFDAAILAGWQDFRSGVQKVLVVWPGSEQKTSSG